jgi:lysophospholipase L1-like esterase
VKRVGALLLTLLLLVAPVVSAADRVVAFGDSLTEGVGDSDSPGGYPPKLRKLLSQADLDVAVENHGLAGETTFDGLTRIDSVLGSGPGYLILMEGTNDVSLIVDGLTSVETTVANLELMGNKGQARGLSVLMGTVVPRPGFSRKDRDNFYTREVNWELYEMMSRKGRPFADGWSRFNPFVDVDVFRTLYSREPGDTVGHLNNAGYQELAQLFADQILENDVLPPVPGRFEPFVTELDGPTDIRATVFESKNGAGIKLKETYFEVNGEVVAKPRKSSNKKRAEFVHKLGRKQLGCRVILGVSGRDQADPPNEFAQLIWAYGIAGREHFPGDIDGDCTVEEGDLEQLARGFGSEFGSPRYSVLLDFNSDDVIDGIDLAMMAASYGQTSD